VPGSAEAVALVLAAARREGWRVRLEGRGSWLVPDAPADLVLSTRGLVGPPAVHPADLVATVPAGLPFATLQAELARHGTWLALDPPGHPDRTVGSVAATGTAGPLRHGFGAVRDHVLGCTVATGDGRLVEAGGRVVKNVAGYDLTKLHLGGFGGFGVITSLHLRLRALPAADLTLLARAGRDRLAEEAGQILAIGAGLAALELLSPTLATVPDWVLAVRFLGTAAGVQAEAARVEREVPLDWERLTRDRAVAFWNRVALAPLGEPVTLRAGVVMDGLEDALDLFTERLGEGLLAAGPGTGSLRWAGHTDTVTLRRLRREAALREIPITLERAPWALRAAVGHFGAYREGVAALVAKLRATFDPGGVLSVALEEPPEGRG
jgi:FAD/FMN-containing dehydrogenase